jgi:hypothetical protein
MGVISMGDDNAQVQVSKWIHREWIEVGGEWALGGFSENVRKIFGGL